MGLTRALLLRPQRPRQVLRTIVIYALAITVMAVFLAPIVWLFISSITPLTQLLTVPLKWIPERPSFEYYNEIITAAPNAETTASNFKVAIGNSLLIAGATTLVCLLFGSLAAYAFARLDVPLGDKFIFFLLFTQMIPSIAIMIPLYLIASRLNMLDRRITLVLVYCSFSLPFVIWMMRGYFQTIPRELEDAAMMDGCSRVSALFRVVMPLSLTTIFPSAWLRCKISFVVFKSTFNVAKSRLLIPTKSASVFAAERNSASVCASSKTSRPRACALAIMSSTVHSQ